MPRGAQAVTSPPARSRGRPGRAGQTLTRARPLRRRAARIARPARVRMRSRNPCVFARWRLFGWNVRLLTETPGTGRPARALTNAPRGFQDIVNRARPAARANRTICGPTADGQKQRHAGQRRRSNRPGGLPPPLPRSAPPGPVPLPYRWFARLGAPDAARLVHRRLAATVASRSPPRPHPPPLPPSLAPPSLVAPRRLLAPQPSRRRAPPARRGHPAVTQDPAP